MKETVTYRYKGWFGLCPIYLDDAHSEEPSIAARWEWLEWFVDFNADVYGFLFSLFKVEEPMWPMKITGKLDNPLTVEYEDKE